MSAPAPVAAPRASVVVPTRDRPALLARAIASVRAQRDVAWELIVVDDGSADAHTRALRDIVATVPDARFVRLESSRGAPAARNAGLARAAGEYVAFLDDDDVWAPAFLARMTAALERDRAADVAYCRRTVEADGKRFVPALPDVTHAADALAVLVAGNFIDTSTALARRARLLEVGGFDVALPRLQDWDLWLRLARGSRFVFVEDVLVESRLTRDGISGSPARLVEACRLLARTRPVELDLDRGARADFFYALATLLMVEGAPAEAGPYFRSSLRARPLQPRRIAAALAARIAPGFYHAVTRARQRAEGR